MLNITLGFFAGIGATFATFIYLDLRDDRKVQDARRADDYIAD